jgi:MFS family permease
MEQLGTAGYVTSAASALVTGWAIDRFIQSRGSASATYKAVMFVTHVGMTGCMVLMAVGSRPLAVVGMFIFQVLTGAMAPGIYAMSQILAGPRASGRWVGIQNSVGNLSGMIAPWITGLVVDRTGHFTLAFALAGMMSALAIVFWVGMVPKLALLRWEPRHVP